MNYNEIDTHAVTTHASNIGLKEIDTNEVNFGKQFVANKFNNFFCTVAANLVEKLPCISDFDDSAIKSFYANLGVKQDQFRFGVISEEEIVNKLSKINVRKATGHDNMDARFVKDGRNAIVTPITYIINLSIEKSQVPSDFKIAKVLPLYKKGDKNTEGNYRPVSVLPALSKIFERVIYDQMSSYLKEHQLLYEYQSGFRECYSTDTADKFRPP